MRYLPSIIERLMNLYYGVELKLSFRPGLQFVHALLFEYSEIFTEGRVSLSIEHTAAASDMNFMEKLASVEGLHLKQITFMANPFNGILTESILRVIMCSDKVEFG